MDYFMSVSLPGLFADEKVPVEHMDGRIQEQGLPVYMPPPIGRGLDRADVENVCPTGMRVKKTPRRNRSALLQAVKRDAAAAWKSLPEYLKSDKDFVIAALSESPKIPPKFEFERCLPPSMRVDRDVVLAFAQREDFAMLHRDRLLFVPDRFRGDKEIMMCYCSKVHRSLQECTDELCDDRDVVMAAIYLDGLSIQYASARLRGDRDVALAACRRDGRALGMVAPGPVLAELTSDRETMLSVVSAENGGPMLRLASSELQQDRQLLLEALSNGIRFSFCPAPFHSNKDFAREALERKSELYLEMNSSLRADPDVALAAIRSPNSTDHVHMTVLNSVSVDHAGRVALAIARLTGDVESLEHLIESLRQKFPARWPILQEDKALLLTAVGRSPSLFRFAGPVLLGDPDFLLAAVSKDTAASVLKAATTSVKLEHPGIAVEAISVADEHCESELVAHIPPELWLDRNVCRAWIQRNFKVHVALVFPVSNSSGAIRLESLIFGPRRVPNHHDWIPVLSWFPDETSLERDKMSLERDGDVFGGGACCNCMLFAVTRAGGQLLWFAGSEIRNNTLELALRALSDCSQPTGRPPMLEELEAGTRRELRSFGGLLAVSREVRVRGVALRRETVSSFLERRLGLRDVFVDTFLQGIFVSQQQDLAPSRRCLLPMLGRRNLGLETSQALHELIADFVGVPTGAELALLGDARNNVSLWESLFDCWRANSDLELQDLRETPIVGNTR